MRTHVEINVGGDTSGIHFVEVSLKRGLDDGHLTHPGLGGFIIAITLVLEDVACQFLDSHFHLLKVDGIFSFFVAHEGAFILEIVEGKHIGFAMSASSTKTH